MEWRGGGVAGLVAFRVEGFTKVVRRELPSGCLFLHACVINA